MGHARGVPRAGPAWRALGRPKTDGVHPRRVGEPAQAAHLRRGALRPRRRPPGERAAVPVASRSSRPQAFPRLSGRPAAQVRQLSSAASAVMEVAELAGAGPGRPPRPRGVGEQPTRVYLHRRRVQERAPAKSTSPPRSRRAPSVFTGRLEECGDLENSSDRVASSVTAKAHRDGEGVVSMAVPRMTIARPQLLDGLLRVPRARRRASPRGRRLDEREGRRRRVKLLQLNCLNGLTSASCDSAGADVRRRYYAAARKTPPANSFEYQRRSQIM